MSSHSRHLALFAVIAAGLLPAVGAQAQYYSVEVAPNTYVTQRPAAARAYPYVGRRHGHAASEQKAPALDRSHKKTDRALIEEMRKRAPVKRTIINTKKIVHDAPVVVETRRVIERRHVVEDAPVRSRRKPAAIADSKKRAGRDDNKKRVIEADAEITIFGPDRMSIRLFRKGQRSKASARAE